MPELLTKELDNLVIPSGFQENLKYRVAYHKECEADKGKQDTAIFLFKRNPVLFFGHCLWTYDPRRKPADRPFVPWDYQEDYIRNINKDIEKGVNALTEKSRDMGVTWNILGVFYYRWLLFDENFLLGSRKEEFVDTIGDMDSHFERLRYFIRTTPKWLLDRCGFNPKNSGYMKIYKDNGASLVGESMNPNFSRQGRYNAILLDEFAFVEKAEVIWTGCGDSAPCKLIVSTPNGSLNTFARLRKSGKTKVYTIPWKKHPNKDDAWYEQQLRDRPERDVRQEIDINYIISAGKPYYGGFRRAIHVNRLSINSHKELILGWDYGWHHPCCVITQIDAKGRLVIHDVLLGENELIQDFAENTVRAYLNAHYLNFPVINYDDPAGLQESDKSKLTSHQLLIKAGFPATSRPSNTNEANYDARKVLIESKMKNLIDGIPALVINDRPLTQIIIEAFEGGYHYPVEDKYGAIKDRPVRDGYYEHVMNALEYIIVNLFSPIPKSGKKKVRQKSKIGTSTPRREL